MNAARFLPALLLVAAPTAISAAADDAVGAAQRHVLPLVLSDDGRREGFVRIVNRDERDGRVTIYARDDAGVRPDPIELSVAAGAVASFNSHDLEHGNAGKGLSGGVGAGQGDWRLELRADVDILASAYVRSSTGFVATVHPLAREVTELPDGRCFVPFLNPGSNTTQVGYLRLDNSSDSPARVEVTARDDQGAPAPAGEVGLTVPAGEVHTVSAKALESGADGLDGRLGDGAGKWRLFVSADGPVGVMSLLESPGGNLVSVSSCKATQPSVPVVVNDEGRDVDEWGADPYEMTAAAIHGDTLVVTVSYSGGCEAHDFTLVVAGTFKESDPVQLTADLAHDANGDACEAWLTEELRFDLGPVQTLYETVYGQADGTIVLALGNAPGGDLTYTFSSGSD